MSIELTDFSYILIKNVPLTKNILKLHDTVVYKEAVEKHY